MKAIKQLGIFTGVWTVAHAGIIGALKPQFLFWQLLCCGIYFGYVYLKWKLVTGKQKELFKAPSVFLSLQGGFFLLALILVAIVMLGFQEEKKMLLPLLLWNYLAFLIFDSILTVKKKPLS